MNLGDIDIFDPKTNIKIGCWYLNKLYKEMNNSEKVLIDVKSLYNRGEIKKLGYKYWRL